MTLTVQSSSATIALLQNFAARPGLDGSSLLGLAGALPVLLGDNIGTTITAVLASLSANRDAKRVAAAHAVFNLTGAAVFCAGLPLYVRLTAALSPKGPELAVIARQIANAHTLFNVVCTLVWLPLTPLMVRFVCRLVPDLGSAVSFYWSKHTICAYTEREMKPTRNKKETLLCDRKSEECVWCWARC